MAVLGPCTKGSRPSGMLASLPPARYRGGACRQLRSKPADWSVTDFGHILWLTSRGGAPANPTSNRVNRHYASTEVHPRGRAAHGEDAWTGAQVDGDGQEQ
eukprot:8655318-Pyramimonas_sp.AAC.1